MNELEQLRLLMSVGKATPEQIERFKTLMLQGTQKGGTENTGTETTPPSVFGYPTGQTARMPWEQPAQTQPNTFLGTQTAPGTNKDLKEQPGLSPASFDTKEEYGEYRNRMGYDITSSEEIWTKVKAGDTPPTNQLTDLPFITPGGSDISTELYTLGRAIGAKKGADGRVLTGVAAGGAALFDIGRNVLSGIGFEKRNQYVEDYYRKKQGDVKFTANPQYENANTTGGFTYGEEGGEAGMQQDPNQQQGLGQGQNPDQSQQIMETVMGMLQQGATPEEVVKALMEQGMPPQQAQQIVQMVVQASSGAAPEEVMKAGGIFFAGGTQQEQTGSNQQSKNPFEGLFKSRYGENDWFDDKLHPGYDPNREDGLSGTDRGIRESRDLARKINKRIRTDVVGDDGTVYNQFSKVHGRDFVSKNELGSFSGGGMASMPPNSQNPIGPGGATVNSKLPDNLTINKEVGDTITFMHKGKKITGVIKENKNGQITLK